MAYFVGAYWGAREESQRECAVRVTAFLEALAREGIGLSQWYKKAKSRTESIVSKDKDGNLEVTKIAKGKVGRVFWGTGSSPEVRRARIIKRISPGSGD